MTGAHRLEGQVAVVTGGANGIGRATALKFASEGAAVVVADVQMAPAEAVVDEIIAAGGRALAVELDARSRESNEQMAEAAVQTFGGLDVMMTAAGISHGGYSSGDIEAEVKRATRRLEVAAEPGQGFLDVELEDWQRVIDVNLTGTFLAMQAAVRQMLELGTKGRIVTIASIAAKNPDAGPTAYTVSKAGVWMLTKKSARELASAGIRVNAIGPGYIRTNMTALIEQIPEYNERLMAAIPLGHVGEPDDIAHAAMYLVTDESGYMTGEILHPAGGYFTG